MFLWGNIDFFPQFHKWTGQFLRIHCFAPKVSDINVHHKTFWWYDITQKHYGTWFVRGTSSACKLEGIDTILPENCTVGGLCHPIENSMLHVEHRLCHASVQKLWQIGSFALRFTVYELKCGCLPHLQWIQSLHGHRLGRLLLMFIFLKCTFHWLT